MLEKLILRQEELLKILHNYDIKEWKVFGHAINQDFIYSADLHFLIISTLKIDHKAWRDLSTSIKKLFPGNYIFFCTPNSLDNLVQNKQLSAEQANDVKNNALDLKQLIELYQKLSEDHSRPKISLTPK